MKYETIPYVDKPVSRILFGTAQPSFLRGEENNAILDVTLEAGITTFDTARNCARSIVLSPEECRYLNLA